MRDEDIKYIHELEERVQELEELKSHYMKQIQFLTHSWDKSKEQNKRYREALEFYADKYNWLPIITPVFTIGMTELDDDIPLVMEDYGEKARKALEGK